MTPERAAEILRIYNAWRRAEGEWADKFHSDLPFSNQELGEAIDLAVKALTISQPRCVTGIPTAAGASSGNAATGAAPAGNDGGGGAGTYFSFLICFHGTHADVFRSGLPLGVVKDGIFVVHKHRMPDGLEVPVDIPDWLLLQVTDVAKMMLVSAMEGTTEP